MKARLLKKLLNNTDYQVHYYNGKVCIGTHLCLDLINVDLENKRINYELAFNKESRESLVSKGKNDNELLFIFDELTELMNSGKLQEMVDGKDKLENPLTVYFVDENGTLNVAYTDKHGYPNITDDGVLMHDNVYFKTKVEAVKKGLANAEAGVSLCSRSISNLQDKLFREKEEMSRYTDIELQLRKLLEVLEDEKG